MFDVLSGALSGTSWQQRPHRLPVSLLTEPKELSAAQLGQFRTNLAHLGIEPAALARRQRPVVFVDLVYAGRTFRTLYTLLDRWIDEVGAPRSVVRTKLRFVGITSRTKTSPNTWRWYQGAEWAAGLPRSALIGVSLDPHVWSYLGNEQYKTARSFPSRRWLDPEAGLAAHDDKARAALAQAVALVAAGRSAATRRQLVSVLTGEPAMREPWLRALVTQLGPG